MIDYYEPNLELTLLGCGFMGGYHVGAICLLEQIWPHRPYNKICGASCGGLLGVLLLAGIKIELVLDNAMSVIKQIRSFLKCPNKLPCIKDLVEENLDKMLPNNAHELCNNRLGLSLTKLWSFDNEFVREFESRQELIDAVVAGCFIPIWSGSLTIPKFRGQKYIDGAYSDNKPKFPLSDEQRSLGVRQIEVSPFASDVEVSPPDKFGLFSMRVFGTLYYFNLSNIYRFGIAMWPTSVENYKPTLQAGHEDMKDYIIRSNLIKCRQCHQKSHNSQQSTVITMQKVALVTPCLVCLKILEKVDSLEMPQKLLDMMKT